MSDLAIDISEECITLIKQVRDRDSKIKACLFKFDKDMKKLVACTENEGSLK